ncbi:GntR family transcriptional regulator [Streptomyces sp. NPDC102384]|uniref:GntR family transcriptional regulator n=1 Tax=Streptomyces sp. NPDC102384 TaxID=3366166 RepID=UPI0037F90CE7
MTERPRPMTARTAHRRPPRVELYERIVAAIHDGTFPPGSVLPSEPTLAGELGVSRPALREVLILLQEDGVITRKHGVGSRVSHQLPPRGLERLSPVEDLLDTTHVDGRRLAASRDLPTDFSAHHLRLSGSDSTWFWETLLSADGVPACFAHEWAADDDTLAEVVPDGPALLDRTADASRGGASDRSMSAVLLAATDAPLTGRSTVGATLLGEERGAAMERSAQTPATLVTQVVSWGSRPLFAAKYLYPAGAPLLHVRQRR